MIVAYFRISRAPPYWILWRHTVAASVSKQTFFCLKQQSNRVTSWNPSLPHPGNLKAKISNLIISSYKHTSIYAYYFRYLSFPSGLFHHIFLAVEDSRLTVERLQTSNSKTQ